MRRLGIGFPADARRGIEESHPALAGVTLKLQKAIGHVHNLFFDTPTIISFIIAYNRTIFEERDSHQQSISPPDATHIRLIQSTRTPPELVILLEVEHELPGLSEVVFLL